MRAGEALLAVDYGAVTTAALACGVDGRWWPLPVDGATVLSSAVAVDADGAVTAGAAAWRVAGRPAPSGRGDHQGRGQRGGDQRGGFVALPVRLGRERALVGGVDVAVGDLVAATLRRLAEASSGVAGAAAGAAAGGVPGGVAGAVPGGVRMVVPAGWGPRQRTWLRQAAHRAGLTRPTLVDAPVAAAAHLSRTGALRVLVGGFVLVCDLGAGCEASVLRRTPDGLEVLSTLADPEAGGAAVDALLLAQITATSDGSALAADRTTAPVCDGIGTSLAAAVVGGAEHVVVETGVRNPVAYATDAELLGSVRAAKQALLTCPAVTVPVPSGPAVVLTAAAMDAAAGPVWARAGRLAAAAVTAADLQPSQLAAVVCVGGGAAVPAAVRAITDAVLPPATAPSAEGPAEAAVEVPVVVPDDPATTALWGATGTVSSQPVAAGAAAESQSALMWPALGQIAAIAVAGMASLALYTHFLLTAQWNNGNRVLRNPGFYVLANWGELAVAALCALLGLTAAATTVARLVAADRGVPLDGPRRGTAILAGAAFGLAVAGLYAIFGSLYFGLPVAPFLRWTLLPLLPVVAVAAAVAGLVARNGRPVPAGWDRRLRLPVASLLCTGVGMLLIQHALTAVRWPNLTLWIDLGGRVGGLLVGVGTALALVGRPLLRLIVAAPLAVFCAAIAGWRGAGVLAVMYAAAVAVWWTQRLWQLTRTPVQPAGHPAWNQAHVP